MNSLLRAFCRFVYISANIPSVPGLDMVLGGYIRGKQMAEDALFRNYPDTGVALRPGVIYGSRAVSNTLTLPLQVRWHAVLFVHRNR